MAPRCMQSAAVVASLTAVSIRIAMLGSISMTWGTRSIPLRPGMRTSSSMQAIFWRCRILMASSPEPAVVTSYPCWVRNFFRAFRIGSSSSTTSTLTGPSASGARTRPRWTDKWEATGSCES